MPVLNGPHETVNAGYFQLNWEGEGERFELQEQGGETQAGTRTLYTGPDTASAISGRADGSYRFRVRQINAQGQALSPWSQALTVDVVHHSLAKAFGFFLLGFLVFISTVAIVLAGTRHVSR
ncbi:MAG: fibronectin type III domain-containing protein [Gammaproteobacteria bacterium]|nr:fibronectin type III domain-containing protein [Gammaproteobacteria bacterium]MDH5691482.1 fibronectin type III domain-containing protein [Gammaproteobacteria bacterium]